MMKNPFLYFKKNEKTTKITSVVLVIALILIALISFSGKKIKTIGETEAKEVATTFINTYLMDSGSKASITDVAEEYGLYKLEVDILSGKVESYLTKDGKLFFPQAINIEEMNSQEKNDVAASPKTEVTNKTDKPVVELFVMSHCPYGTQMEKGILPVVRALGDSIDFRLMFNDYAMHAEPELTEQMNQYCLMNEQSSLYYDYLECFLVAGDSKTCLAEVKADTKALNSCFDKLEKENKIIANFKNKVGFQGNYPSFNLFTEENNKYNVGGSPTLVINEESISSSRDSNSLLYTICSAFVTPPDACFSAVLPSAAPAPGFGTGTANSSSDASCD